MTYNMMYNEELKLIQEVISTVNAEVFFIE